MIVARDGAIGLPALSPTKDIYCATEQFNRCCAALLVGGVYCEAITQGWLGAAANGWLSLSGTEE
jgi:hypothetical protein